MTEAAENKEHTAGQKPAGAPPKGKRRWPRRVGVVLLILLLLGVATAGALPWALSTAAGTRATLVVINGLIPGTVSASSLSVGWFSGQEAHGLVLNDPMGQPVVTLKSLEARDATLWSLLTGSRDIGLVRVVEPVGRIERYADGTTNLGRALSPQTTATTPKATPRSTPTGQAPAQTARDTRIKLDITGAALTLIAPGIDTVTIEGSAAVDVPSLRTVTAGFEADISNQAGESGRATGSLRLDNLFDQSGRLTSGAVTAELDVDITGLPIQAADRVLGYHGRLAGLLGTDLDLGIKATGDSGQVLASIKANSDRLHIDAQMHAEPGQITVKQGSSIRLTVDNATLAGWATDGKPLPVGITEPIELVATVLEMQTPLLDQAIDVQGATASLRLAVAKANLLITQGTDLDNAQAVALHDAVATLGYTGRTNNLLGSITAGVLHDGVEGRLDLQARLDGLNSGITQRSLEQASGELHCRLDKLPLALIDGLTGSQGLVALIAGPHLDGEVKATLLPAAGDATTGQVTANIEFNARSQNISAHAAGELTPQRLLLREGGEIRLSIQPLLARALVKRVRTVAESVPAFTLGEPTNLRIELTGLELPFEATQRHAIRVGLRAAVDNLVPEGIPRFTGLAVRGVSLVLPNVTAPEPIALRAEAVVEHGTQAGRVEADLVLTDWMEGPLRFSGAADISDLPVALIEQVAERPPGDISTWIDTNTINSLALKLNTTDPADPGVITASGKLQSDGLQADLAGAYKLDDQLAVIQDGSWLRWRWQSALAPHTESATGNKTDLSRMLRSPPNDPLAKAAGATGRSPPDTNRFVLIEPPWIKLTVASAQVGFQETQSTDRGANSLKAPSTDNTPQAGTRLDPARTRLDVDGHLTAAFRQTDDPRTLRVDRFALKAATKNLLSGLRIDVTGGLSVIDKTGAATPGGSIDSSTRLTGLFTPNGEPSPDNIVVDTKTTIDTVPVALIDSLARQNGQLLKLLGDQAKASISGPVWGGSEGAVHLKLESPRARATVAGNVNQDGVLTLAEDAALSLSVDEQLSREWLHRVNPLLRDAIGSEQPVELTIKHEGFAAPVKDFSLSKLRASGELNLGVLRFSQKGVLNLIRRAFRRDTSQAPVASFTPMRATFADGVLQYRDMTMTVDNLVLVFSGRVDQVNERLDTVMGVSGQTMAKAFGLGDTIEQGYQLQVPYRGPLDNPQLDLSVVVKEVARLAATSQIKKELGNTVEGAAAGAVLDLLLGGQKQQPTPDRNPGQDPGQPNQIQDDNNTDEEPAAEPQPEQRRPESLLEQILRQREEEKRELEERRKRRKEKRRQERLEKEKQEKEKQQEQKTKTKD